MIFTKKKENEFDEEKYVFQEEKNEFQEKR